jgi:hypothetical protein
LGCKSLIYFVYKTLTIAFMNRLLLLLILMGIGQAASAQYVYTIKADSVKITNSCDTAELIIENHTQTVPGFLYNKGRGRTEFRRGAIQINDSLFLIGSDTIKLNPMRANNGTSLSNAKVVLGQNVGEANNPAVLLSNREVPMNNHDINFNGGNIVLSGSGSVNKPLLQFWDETRGIWSQGADMLTIKAGFNSFLTICRSGVYNGVNISDVPSLPPTARLSVLQTASINDTGSFHLEDIRGTYAPNLGPGTFNCLGLYPVINQTGTAAGVTRGIYLNPTVTAAADFRAIEVTRGKSIINGPVTVNSASAPTAGLLLGAGSAAAGAAPLKLTTGTILSTPENGAIEFDGTDLYLTENTSRYKLAKTIGGQITTSFGGISLSAFTAITNTLTVAGAQPGDVVNVSANSGATNSPSLIITAYVTSANTVTLQAYNASSSAVTIASDTYKVRVIK